MDSFLKPAMSQNRWYGLYPGKQTDSSPVASWHTGSTKLNSSFGRIARKNGSSSTPPASRRISQDIMRKWERSAREASVICNQTASFNRCLFKVQQEIQSQLKTIRSESKGKASKKVSEASDELQFLMTFNNSITQGHGTSYRFCLHHHGQCYFNPSGFLSRPPQERHQIRHSDIFEISAVAAWNSFS